MTTARRCLAAALILAAVLLATGCAQWRGLNSLPMPGTQGRGEGSFLIQVQMPDVSNLEPNSRVRVGDVSVGTVTRIERQGWHALLTVTLDGDVDLPANATVKLGQTSLLGSLHLELAPPTDEPSQGRLAAGSLIPLSHSGSYPTTEETLAAVSSVLNGGGLGHVQDITEAFSTAFRGREQDLRSLIGELDTFTADLDDQTPDIIAATDSLNQLAAKFAARRPVLDRALETIPDALVELNRQKEDLVNAADQFAKFSALTVDTVNQTKDNLVAQLQQIGPVLKSLADAGPSLTRSLSLIATFPFPNETIENWQRGDYANLTAIVDLTLSRIDAGLFTGTRWEGDLTELEMQWGRTIGQFPSPYTRGNPLVVPYRWDQGP
ncbi:virulence factor Mce family protein [Mycobacterium sp. SMC-8]|uniref:virulence factor Mce family protein n=1 Tax=Mycobacterium sp. SMC-8 TaxID=2857060 RepID=UPI0021B2978B|nr:virulence factor Mce family protein [Mycobacterium sp. SMC-8]UXA13978.1 virulence factor Mce family protein [Mycobacterium sp. SMC-8]